MRGTQPGEEQGSAMAKGAGGLIRDAAFGIVRSAHERLLLKPLPERLAIYFHALPEDDYEPFRTCIRHLRDLGYRIVPVSELTSHEASGRMLFVSFDDNYQSWHRALGLLDVLDVQATFYVNTLPFMDTCPEPDRLEYFRRIDYSRSTLTLTRAELRDIARAGHEIGCHSHSHFNLAHLERARWDDEIRACRHRLEEIVDRPVEQFAYPYGMRRYFTPALRGYCRQIGFRSIATAIPGLQHAPIDPFSIHRTRWQLASPLQANMRDLQIDGRLFEALTGRSAVG